MSTLFLSTCPVPVIRRAPREQPRPLFIFTLERPAGLSSAITKSTDLYSECFDGCRAWVSGSGLWMFRWVSGPGVRLFRWISGSGAWESGLGCLGRVSVVFRSVFGSGVWVFGWVPGSGVWVFCLVSGSEAWVFLWVFGSGVWVSAGV